MYTPICTILALATRLALVAADNSYAGGFIFNIYPLVREELDPIVSPNRQSSHMHHVVGGSGFSAAYNYDAYSGSSCSSVQIQADKSNYWMPTLYFSNTTGQYISVDVSARMYYFVQPNSPAQGVSPFPPGLRMLVGSPDNKQSNMPYAQFDCQRSVNGTMVRYTATDFNYPYDCDMGMRTEIFFPPCWDGYNLYKSDGSHVSYPAGGNVRFGECPISHPVRMPAILLEFTWDTSKVAPGQALAGHLLWANGDTTGYGIHADFVNGWDVDVLGAALNSSACGIGTGSTYDAVNCPVLFNSYDDTAAQNCKPTAGLLAEPTGNGDDVPISALPGCNLPWGASGSKPTCSPAVAGLDVSALTGTDGAYTVPDDQRLDFRLPTTPGWAEISCTDIVPVSGGPNYVDNSMTQQSCQASCNSQGYQYAATGQRGPSWICYCGNTFDTTLGVSPGMCTTACPGNSSETCGAQYYYKSYYAPNGTAQSAPVIGADGASVLGCYANPSNKTNGLLGKATYSFSSNSMTTETCVSACAGQSATWAATTSAMWCYCGTDLTDSYGTGSLVPSSYCTLNCTGNSTEICGGFSYSNVYDVSQVEVQASTAYHPAGYQGCYAEVSGTQPLTNNSWPSNSMTSDSCVSGCASLGYTYAALQNGVNCLCGDTFKGGQKLPESQCVTPCSGNKNITCGAYSNVDLYLTSSANTTVASVAASKPEGYAGCFSDTGTPVALTNYTYQSTSMTVGVCQKACAGFGYQYAGLKGGINCRCGGALPTTQQLPASQYCSTQCKGLTSETCGGNTAIEVYSAAAAPVGIATDAAYVGCYSDSPVGLTGTSFLATNMTIEICRTGCMELGYSLGGVRSGNTCYCGNAYKGGQKLPDSSCSTKCPGNATESCGGSSIVSVWETAGAPAVKTMPAGYLGCYIDSSSNRLLPSYYYSASPMTPHACQISCSSQGYSYAGVENGNQCWCASTIASGAQRTANSQCGSLCQGTTTNATCGGYNLVDIYNSSAAAVSNGVAGYRGCFSDYSTLTGFTYSSDYMSVDLCTTMCAGKGYTYGGVRAGSQCKCGNTAPTMAIALASCVSNCTANPSQNCGTTTGIAVYGIADSGASSASFTLSPNATGYVGCFTDGGSRLLPNMVLSTNSLTNTMCIQNCQAMGFAYAGTENGNQCWCGSAPNATSGNYQIANADCSTACAGGGAICGAYSKLSVWEVAKAGVTAITTPSGSKGCYAVGTFVSSNGTSYISPSLTPDLCRRSCNAYGFSIAGVTNANKCLCSNSVLYGSQVAPGSCSAPCSGNNTMTCGNIGSNYVNIYDSSSLSGAVVKPPAGYPAEYVGCYPEASGSRALPNQYPSQTKMTTAMCRSYCTNAGFRYYGTEVGVECFCGSALPSTGLILDSQCSTPCGGDSTQFCGGSSKLSVYDSQAAGVANTTSSIAPSASASKNSTTNSTMIGTSKSASSTSILPTSISKSASSSVPQVSVTSSTLKSATSSHVSVTSSEHVSVTSAVKSTTAVPSATHISSSSKAVVSSTTAIPSSKAESVTKSVSSSASSSKTESVTRSVTSAASSSKATSVTVTHASSTVQSSKAALETSISHSSSSSKASSSAVPSVTSVSEQRVQQSSTSARSMSSSSAKESATSTKGTPISIKESATSTSVRSTTSSTVHSTTHSSVVSTTTRASTTISHSVTSASASASSLPAITDSTYVGCYSQSSPIVSGVSMNCTSLTPGMCKVWCKANSYTYSGTTNGNYCGCTNDISELTAVPAESCNTPCIADKDQMCGGSSGDVFSIYKSSSELVGRFDSSTIKRRKARRNRF